MGTQVEPDSVLVKVKVKDIYLCVWYKEFTPAPPGEYSYTTRGVGKNVYFRHLSRRISETVQDRVQVAIER